MSKKISKKDKIIYADILKTRYSEYANIFIKDKLSKRREYLSFLEGISIALLTNYVISFLFGFDKENSTIFFLQGILFIISIIIITYLIYHITKNIRSLERDVSDFEEIKKIDQFKFINEIEKIKGYDYTKKLLLSMIYEMEKNIRTKK